MYIVNLRASYASVVNAIELAKECRQGDNDLALLDEWMAEAESDYVLENRLAVVRAVYPEYRYDSASDDMAPDYE